MSEAELEGAYRLIWILLRKLGGKATLTDADRAGDWEDRAILEWYDPHDRMWHLRLEDRQ